MNTYTAAHYSIDPPIKLLIEGIDVGHIYRAIKEHPEYWDEHNHRTRDPQSPHYELNDIWARFVPVESLHLGEQSCEWYPSADVLQVRETVTDIYDYFGGTELGGVLITRIPPGKMCRPHSDTGWHAAKYEKFGLQIASAPGQQFCFDDAALDTKPGDLFWFDNSKRHWVINPTEHERITMIICFRR